MKTQYLFGVITLLLLSQSVYSDYTPQVQVACPEAWEDTTKEIPVVWQNTDPWAGNATDKAAAQSYIANAKVIETIDPATTEALLSDALTIASECLKYRNFMVDTATGTTTPNVPLNTATGWIPAAIF